LQDNPRIRGAYYAATLAAFAVASSEEILGTLASNSAFAIDAAQRDAMLPDVNGRLARPKLL
jgi:hypothetical protein